MDIPLFLVHSSVDGHLDYFNFLPTMNNVAMNIYVRGFVCTPVLISLESILRSVIAESMVTLLDFQRNFQNVLKN